MVRIRLVSKSPERQVFNIGEKIARQSSIMKHIIEKCSNIKENVEVLRIPVNVSVLVLEKIIQWADYRKNDPESSVVDKRLYDLCRWDMEFFEENRGMLIELIKAADLLKFEQLYCDASVFVSDIMRKKTHKEVKEYFKLGLSTEKALSMSSQVAYGENALFGPEY